MANNSSYANSHISESSLGSYRNLAITDNDNVSNEISQLRDTLKYVCAKLDELNRDNFKLKSKVAENKKQNAELSNKVESQEITINQLEQKISETELSVEDLRLKLTNEVHSRCSSTEPSHQTCKNESEDEERLRQRILNQDKTRKDIEVRLGVKKQMMGELGGFGHYFGDDQRKTRAGVEEEYFKNILEIMFLGQTEFNLKTYRWRDYDVSSFGYTLKICRSSEEVKRGDNINTYDYFHLSVEHKEMRIKFKVQVDQICHETGEILDTKKLESFVDEKVQPSHSVKVKRKAFPGGLFLRWNVTLLKKIKFGNKNN